MRNYVSKVLIGTATANTAIAPIAPTALTSGQVIAFDWDTQTDIKATSVNIGFARGMDSLGAPIFAGPIPVNKISSAVLNPYVAPVAQVRTLTVDAVPAAGKTVIFKVTYHDNLSIIPNQMKQTIVSVVATTANIANTTTWAAAIAAEFNKQVFLFVSVVAAVNVITFSAITLLTTSQYNHIDRPESVVFELGVPDDTTLGVYVTAQTVAPNLGQGTAAKIAWLEEQAMGRRGYSDRRLALDTKKYQSDVVSGETYATLIINADDYIEGDMQSLYPAPVGAVICGDGASLANILTDLSVANIVPVTVAG